jgi:hypothetical protein
VRSESGTPGIRAKEAGVKIKPEVRDIVGKTIVGVLVADNPRVPGRQVFLVFNDNTYYEFYGPDGQLGFTGGACPGGMADAERYAGGFGGTITKFE